MIQPQRRWVRDGGRVLLASLFILIYCVIQRGPILYGDSFAYYKIGALATKALDPAAPLPAILHQARSVRSAQPGAAEARRKTLLSYTEAGARSPYYALPTYWLIALGSVWFLVAAQALVVASVMLLAFRKLSSERFYLPAMAALSLFSTLPLFTTFAMPDFMAAPTILATILAIWRWPSLSRGERIFLIGVVAYGGLVHTTHKLIAAALAVAGLLLPLVTRRVTPARAGSISVLAAVAVATLGGTLYPIVVRGTIHERIYSPPFLTARLFADGEGREFLERHCKRDENSLAMCRFRHDPVRDSNLFLWRPDGIYQSADYETRIRMSREDKRIFIGTALEQPWAVIRQSLLNSVRMLVDFRPSQLLVNQGWILADQTLVAHLDPDKRGCGLSEPRCMARVGPQASNVIAYAGVIAGLVAIGAMLLRRIVDRKVWSPLVASVLLALAVNAVLCGSLSSPVSRYQARICWLIPALALMMTGDAVQRRSVRHGRKR